MATHDPAVLDSEALARRLHDLVGDERRVQVDFLLYLDEFDRRQVFLGLGFGSLWDYCRKALHLREGAAGRRIGAMRVLRRFPRLEAPLRDGRLCLSTASLLGQILTDENLDELVGRAAFLTKAEVEHLVVPVRPRTAPRDGIRRLTEVTSAAGQAEEVYGREHMARFRRDSRRQPRTGEFTIAGDSQTGSPPEARLRLGPVPDTSLAQDSS